MANIGVRCDNRVLLRESGAQSDIPPLSVVICSTLCSVRVNRRGICSRLRDYMSFDWKIRNFVISLTGH